MYLYKYFLSKLKVIKLFKYNNIKIFYLIKLQLRVWREIERKRMRVGRGWYFLKVLKIKS